MKKTNCECGSTYRTSDRKRHELTRNHLDFFNKPNVPEITNTNIYEEDSDTDISETVNVNASDFLIDLNNDKYISQSDIDKQNKDKELAEKESEKQMKQQERNIKMANRKVKPVSDDIDDEIYSSTPTVIHGKEKLLLLKKVQQYKALFKIELKSFKIKKNANSEELKLAIDEMQNLIETVSTDEFITDGILSSLNSFLICSFN